MKTINSIFLFLSFLAIFSCKKECPKNETKNILSGKIKTLTEYNNYSDSSNLLNRYYFYYDTLTGYLDSVILESKLSGIYFYKDKYVTLRRINDSFAVVGL